jgi:hypothetical protein
MSLLSSENCNLSHVSISVQKFKILKYFLITAFSLIYSSVFTANTALHHIPDSLISGADALILSKSETIEIFSRNKIRYECKQKSVIYKNDKNTSPTTYIVPYNLFVKVNKLLISISSADGKKIKEFSRKDFKDFAYNDGFSVANDARYLYLKLDAYPTPFLVEFFVSTDRSQSYHLPELRFYEGANVSVLEKEFKVLQHDPENKLMVKSDIDFPYTESEIGGAKQYIWNMSNISVNAARYFQNESVYFRMNNFEMDGFAGNSSDWKELGNWFFKLNQSAGELDNKSKAEISSLIESIKSPREKVNVLYSYLQNNMRYVSVQLGIGGLRPMAPQKVHNSKYGDCKALSFYMKQLLDIAGIDSRYIIIRAGTKGVEPEQDYVMDVFNHVILCALVDHDTIFLECTSKTLPPGYLSHFTSNRTALLIEENNSRLIKTPTYDHHTNMCINRYIINPSENRVEFFTHRTGVSTEVNNLDILISMDNSEFQKNWNDLNSDISNLRVLAKSIYIDKNIPVLDLNMEFAPNKKITRSGKRYIIETSFEKSDFTRFLTHNKRKNLWEIVNGITLKDSIELAITENCKVEKTPKTVSIDNNYGSLNLSVNLTSELLVFSREVTLKISKIPSEEAELFSSFMDKINKGFSEKLILVCDK